MFGETINIARVWLTAYFYRSAAMYKWTQCVHPNPRKSADREDTQSQLGSGLQESYYDTSPHVLWKWGTKFVIFFIHDAKFLPFQRFTQYLASSNSNFQLANFLDKTGVQGRWIFTKEMFKLWWWICWCEWYCVIQGLDKLQGAIAHAVYMDQGVKQNFEKMRAIGSCVSCQF